MLDAMKCRMEQNIEGNCYCSEENCKNSNENYFSMSADFEQWREKEREMENREQKSRWKVMEIQSMQTFFFAAACILKRIEREYLLVSS